MFAIAAMTATRLIKTRFLILSDTHSAVPLPDGAEKHIAFRQPLPRADVLLHCGDLTMIGHLHEYEKALAMLESIEAELKLVVAGNHDISLCETTLRLRKRYRLTLVSLPLGTRSTTAEGGITCTDSKATMQNCPERPKKCGQASARKGLELDIWKKGRGLLI